MSLHANLCTVLANEALTMIKRDLILPHRITWLSIEVIEYIYFLIAAFYSLYIVVFTLHLTFILSKHGCSS